MTGWKRADSIQLGHVAIQAGFDDISTAEDALMIGARFLVHNFTQNDIDRMITQHYRAAAGLEALGRAASWPSAGAFAEHLQRLASSGPSAADAVAALEAQRVSGGTDV